MKQMMITAALVACFLMGTARAVPAGEEGRRVGGTVEESVKTGGRAVRDGAITFGRTTRAFFTGGTAAAREAWNANARHTAETARAGGRATREAAGGSN